MIVKGYTLWSNLVAFENNSDKYLFVLNQSSFDSRTKWSMFIDIEVDLDKYHIAHLRRGHMYFPTDESYDGLKEVLALIKRTST